ncbi:putative cytochrome P450 [Dioscorea sansibarensis]
MASVTPTAITSTTGSTTWPLSFPAILQAYPEILLSLSCFLFIFYYSHRRSIAPVNWPVIGMFPAVISHFRHFHDHIVDVLRETRWTFRFTGPWFWNMNYIVTCDPSNVNHILSVNFTNYPKGEHFNEIFEMLGDGIFNSDGDAWRIQRKAAHIFIRGREFRSFVGNATKNKAENGLFPALEHFAIENELFDLQNMFMRVAFDVTCIMVFGVDPGCLSTSFPTVPFAKAIDEAWEVFVIRHAMPKTIWKAMKWLQIGHERRLASAWLEIDRFIAQQISQRKIRRRTTTTADNGGETSTDDLLTCYINNPVGDGTGVFGTDKFLRDTMLAMMIAGRDGLGVTPSWLFWLLSKNPNAKAKLEQELLNAQKAKNGVLSSYVTFTTEELSSMVYLHGVVCETLRLYPVVPYEEKGALEEDELPSGEKVAPGSKVLFSVYAMGRMESIWGEDWMEFRPERWLTESGKLRHVPAYKFMAFNCGPRICLGKEIALMQVKMVVAAVLSNFDVEVDERHLVVPAKSVILRMKHGLIVKVNKKKKKNKPEA